MNLKTLLVTILLLPTLAKAQIPDTLAKKITINGFCLCKTTLTDLKKANTDLKQVDVEEMDLAKGCYGQDSRYVASTGYSSGKQPGLIFQKDQESDYVSKIRLTTQFKGRLPDGQVIDLSNLLLKDLLKLYPKFKDKWGSRDCSGYWNFSNDTISFYVKIDPDKKPQFPINEAYYMNKPVEAVDLMMSCYSLKKDVPEIVFEEDATDPVFFIDSVRVNKRVLQNYKPEEIASVTVYKDSSAIKRMGPAAKNGLIYIETKDFAKNKYWNYFKSKSDQYGKLVPTVESDVHIQYILNKRVLKENYEGDLAAINNTIFKGLQIITKQQLIKDYGVTDKEFGVIITSEIPANLHNGKNKF
ncbi:MAG: hypothetical protein M3O71_10490 [Bacteroidota bacterium]|nr:hypothetical protein [Bacteroidota bacterium]